MITQHIDKKRATRMARNLAGHLAERHAFQIGHAQAMHALAATLGYTRVNALTADLKNTPDPKDTAGTTQDNSAHTGASDHVFVVLISDKDGSFAEAFTTRDAAHASLIAFALDTWFDHGPAHRHPDPTALDDDTLLREYFDGIENLYEIFDLIPDRPDQPPRWTPHHAADARVQGWSLDTGARAIRTADPARFADDAAADAFVRRMAARGAMLARDSRAALADAGAADTAPRYIATVSGTGEVGPWSHVFDDPQGARDIRFVYDRVTDDFVLIEIAEADGYRPLERASADDVRDSLLHGNPDLLDAPASYGLDSRDDIPDWARARLTT